MQYVMLFIILTVAVATAGGAPFRLRDYVPPEYEQRSLTLKPDFDFMSGWYRDIDVLDSTAVYNVDSTPVNLDLGAVLQYDRTVNREMYQSTEYARLSGSYGYVDHMYNNTFHMPYYNTRVRTMSMSVFLDCYKNLRWYPADNLFMDAEVKVMTDYRYRGFEEDYEYDTTRYNGYMYSSYDDNQMDAAIVPGMDLGIGTGRIHDVTHARSALYIIRMLKRRGMLAGPDDGAAITGLADEIVRISERRVFDTRLQDIEAVTDLHVYLTRAGLVDSIGMRYAAELTDLWKFAGLQSRRSGWAARVGMDITYTIYYSGEIYLDELYTVRNMFGNYALELRLDYNLPLTPVWQLDAWGEVRKPFDYRNNSHYDYFDNGYRFPIIEEWDSYVMAAAYAAVRYLPTTRTAYKLSAAMKNYGGEMGYEDFNIAPIGVRYYSAYASCTVEHYISPRLKVIGGYGFHAWKHDNVRPFFYSKENFHYDHGESETVRHAVNFSVEYSIF